MKKRKRKEIKLTKILLILAIFIFGTFLFVNASVEELTITFQDEVLCSKVANELKTYKNNDNEKAVNYLRSSDALTVTIDKENLQYIKKLNLSGSVSTGNNDSANQISNLSGLGSFTDLEELYLDNNTRISTKVTSNSNIHEIYSLSNLKKLSLSGTLIYNDDIYSNSETYNISNLHNLTELNLSSTNISSAGLRTELGALTNLEVLNLSNNHNIKNISQIINWVKELNIDNTGITDIEGIKSFSSLEKLFIGHNSITNIEYIYSTYYNEASGSDKLYLPKLKSLNMDYMNDGYKTGNIFSNLQVLNLQSLSLRGNDIYDLNGLTTDISDSDKTYMQSTLTYLDLADNNINSVEGVVYYETNENDVRYVKYRLGLTTLILTNNQIQNINELGYLNTLTTLKLGNNRISNISPIANMKFANGQLELNNQRLSTYVYLSEENSKQYQYVILPNILQEAKKPNSLVYSEDVNLVTQNCDFNYEKDEYRQPGSLNVKLDRATPTTLEMSITLQNGLADGTKIKYTFEYCSDSEETSKTNFNSQNNDPVETIKFNDKNLDEAIYKYLTSHMEDYNITYLERVPYIININRSSIEQITELDISNHNISDLEGIQNFTTIQKLDMSNNNISTAEQIKYMKNMTDLNASINKLGNQISFITEMYELKALNLSSNGISDLTSFNVFVNNLSENWQDKKLQTLNLGSNSISDITVISKFDQLSNLNLSNNKIDNINSFSSLSKLGILDLSVNDISDINSLRNLSNLNTLYIDNNNLTDIEPLTNLSLTTLAISSNRITDITPLKNRNLLKRFYANDNKIDTVTPIDTASHSLLIDSDGILQLHMQRLVYKLTNEENAQETVTIQLPQIFQAAKTSNSMFYTVEDLETSNCEVSGNNVIVKPSNLNGKNAVVTIVGGRADKTTFTIGQPPLSNITYNPAKTGEKIKGSVEASLTFNKENVTILNNDGNNKYTFTNNGEFTFEYMDEEGFEGTAKASVDWLDNEGPKVQVQYVEDKENNKVQVIITSDEEMQKVTNWELSDGNKKLTRIYSESKTENVIVKDKLGNETTVEVKVTITTDEPDPIEEKIESKTYTINTDNNIITKINSKTKVEDFIKNVTIEGGTYKVVNKNGTEIKDTTLVSTGSKIITSSNKEYTIVVIGDADGDGKAGISDLSRTINEYVSSKSNLNNIQKLALDINGNDKIDISDVSMMVNLYRNT